MPRGRGGVRGAGGGPRRPAPPRSPAAAPPAPALTLGAPAAAAQFRPARQRPEMQRGAALCLRLWLCLGLLDGERGELSARPSARLAARGTLSRGE